MAFGKAWSRLGIDPVQGARGCSQPMRCLCPVGCGAAQGMGTSWTDQGLSPAWGCPKSVCTQLEFPVLPEDRPHGTGSEAEALSKECAGSPCWAQTCVHLELRSWFHSPPRTPLAQPPCRHLPHSATVG